MWIQVIGCVILVIFLSGNELCADVPPYMVHRNVETGDKIKISKNITIHRNGYGRFLGLLKMLKGSHHKRHVYDPYVISRLWRASFEFEMNPRPIFEHPSNIYFPTDFVIKGGGKPPSIDSIFHFGNNEQQSSVTIGGSNQITKGERDEMPSGQNVINKDAIDAVIANDTANEVSEKSERVLRHAIHARIDDESDVGETTISSSSLNTEESETSDMSMAMPQTTTPTETQSEQTAGSTETLILQTTILDEAPISQTTGSIDHQTNELGTSTRPESSSTEGNYKPLSSTPLPSEWLGYYDFGIHKPEFIQSIEFTTNSPPKLVHYVAYEAPFKPSRPDYTANAYPYSTNFFTALKHFKR